MYRTLTMVGVLAVVVLALLILACGSDPTPAAVPTADPTTAIPEPTARPTTPAPIAQPTPEPTVAPTPAPTAAPTAASPTPAPTPEEPEETDPSDAYFAMDRVLEISIEIAEEDWDTLRHQTRTFDDLMAEIEKYQLSQPFADIYSWFSATVTIDGETHTEFGVRKKGFLGSQSDTKPSLKLRYDKYVDDQSLGGVMERMTLNNSIQDASMVNTCLSYQVFAAAGVPSPRCNFATVTVNGKELGLYIHLEELKKPFLARHFDSVEGNLYEGTVSDFTPEYGGTFEKKTNEDEDDWTDVDAVMAALQDPSDAGLEALGEIVDLDQFLSFWATEVLVGHWDGYAGDRNNYHFYREPEGKFVFLPWGADDTFHLKDDPNPFDNISNPPPSVLALTSIPNRLYNTPEWRVKYAERLKEILDTAWDEDALLDTVDGMAAIVQEHALPEARAKAAADTERVRKFILKRKGEILADITPDPPDWPAWPEPPEPPDWPEPADSVYTWESLTVELHFETTWGSLDSPNPGEEGSITAYWVNDVEMPAGEFGAAAGLAAAEEAAELGPEEAAVIAFIAPNPDSTLSIIAIWMPVDLLVSGANLTIGEGGVGGASWEESADGMDLYEPIPIRGGLLELVEVGTGDGEAVSGSFSGVYVSPQTLGAVEGMGQIEPGTVELQFETAWGSNESVNPFEEGTVTSFLLNGTEQHLGNLGVTAGFASPDEMALLPGIADAVSLTVFSIGLDGSIQGLSVVLSMAQISPGAILVIGEGGVAGGGWSIPGGTAPDMFFPFTGGSLQLIEAGTGPGETISGRFSGSIGGAPVPDYDAADSDEGSIGKASADIGLFINEVAAKGDPLDWFELYNGSDSDIALGNFVVADDLDDAGKRVAFPPGTTIAPGEYLHFELDKDGWPGFALGGDEELGVWTSEGVLVDSVDWDEGQSGEGESFARLPDGTGEFHTVVPTPGDENEHHH